MYRNLVYRILFDILLPGQRPNFTEVRISLPIEDAGLSCGDTLVDASMPPIINIHTIHWRANFDAWIVIQQVAIGFFDNKFENFRAVIRQHSYSNLIILEDKCTKTFVRPI